ncbi:DUF4352 domain-containing protein [Persicimonas caeni]|uniref:DUF4352 domain-containing protein n=1 Tax=Persicimonas caeni TaxID=2292766 RepID=A0A4Y6PU00_PERCE|nr:DUF4352 domain-containing protein [Persicimonas caeni]QDG51599.1 DUF4352 domain-containing protein [Persicimonas caeni]QED32820.1 DUF4352 domain-containing protein [Persicimonas caeni]
MTNPFGFRVARVLLLVAAALLTAGAACEKPAVTEMKKPVQAGGVQFNVTGYDVRYLELNADGKTVEYPEPVLAINVEVTNQKDQPLTYTPSHRTQQVTEANAPLLYQDPGKEADLPPASKQTINGVFLEEGQLDEQVTQSKTLAKGESLTDVFLFEVPEAKEAALILSLPPTMHHGAVPVLFRIPYQYQKPKGPTVHEMGKTVSAGPVGFTVEKAEVAYIKTKHTIEGEGYSSNPRLKISYKVENTGKEPITYSPEHNVEGARGAALYSGGETFNRVKMPSNAEAEGQITDSTEIKPGKSVTDFVLFERPSKEVKSVTFVYPADRFGGEGLVRVEVPYEYKDPELPKELKKKKAEKKDD